MQIVRCPLCGFDKTRPSWLAVDFNDKSFRFLECADCQSLICDPMPDEQDIAVMYGDSYLESDGEPANEGLGKFREVLELLRGLPTGTFLDYGCGDGRLLRAVGSLGWHVVGIDYNPEFAAELREDGIRVFGHTDTIDIKADIVHLGDVLEHLTDLESEFPKIMAHVKPGGILVAHGPLEGNPNLFFRLIRAKRRFSETPSVMPPFHVTQSTTKGQRALFERFGLIEEVFRVNEIAFPAPEKLIYKPRGAALYFLRKLSQAVSAFNIENLGNRYFYVGKRR